MGIFQKKGWIERRELIILIVLIMSFATYYVLFFTPKDSLELYQAISFADNFEEAQMVMLEGYEDNFKAEDFEFMNRPEHSADRISQFTLFEYDEKTYLVMTTPGTEKLKVLAVEELPAEIREYFLEWHRK